LVAEENATARRVLARLARSIGLEVEEAADGWDAMRALSLASAPFELLLLGAHLGDMQGLDCAQRVAERLGPGGPAVVLMMPGQVAQVPDDAVLARAAVAAMLDKPVTLAALLAACATALDRSDAGARPAERSPPPPVRALLAGKRVLLVEDNEINRELALELLGDAGLVVSVAADGREAIDALGREAFDLVLMDCQMPLMDGYQATRAIRADPRWPGLPIVAMTANAMAGDRELALAAGMNDHIAKPIVLDEMFATIARWVR
jgi:CheY-like chemotaxis protein